MMHIAGASVLLDFVGAALLLYAGRNITSKSNPWKLWELTPLVLMALCYAGAVNIVRWRLGLLP